MEIKHHADKGECCIMCRGSHAHRWICLMHEEDKYSLCKDTKNTWMQPSESCVMTCTLNQRPVYEVTTAEAFRCFNKPQKVNCSWGPRQNRKRQEEVIAAVCFFCLNWEKKTACNEFLSLRFFITKTEAYLLTTVLPWNDMCGERFGFAPQCFHLEGQSCRCQTQANQITPCCWNTVKCAHTWQALSKDASPSSLLQRSCVCYLFRLPFSSEGGWRSTAK